MARNKKKKVKYVDDGHTVYSMENLDGNGKCNQNKDDIKLTRKEKRAAIFAALGFYMPRILLIIGCFSVVGVLLYFWLM